jgi:hypothetical protein
LDRGLFVFELRFPRDLGFARELLEMKRLFGERLELATVEGLRIELGAG